MQRAIQNTQAATRRRSRPLRVAGSTLTANVAFAVLKYAADPAPFPSMLVIYNGKAVKS